MGGERGRVAKSWVHCRVLAADRGRGGLGQSCVEVLRDRGALGRNKRGVAEVGKDYLPGSYHAELEAVWGAGAEARRLSPAGLR